MGTTCWDLARATHRSHGLQWSDRGVCSVPSNWAGKVPGDYPGLSLLLSSLPWAVFPLAKPSQEPESTELVDVVQPSEPPGAEGRDERR